MNKTCKLHRGALPKIIFLVSFAGKRKKLDQPFQVLVNVHPCHPLQWTTGNSLQASNIVLNNKIGPLFL